MKKVISFPGETGQLAEVRNQARLFLTENGFEECHSEMLVLAIDEACTNIIRHAYDYEALPIQLEMERLTDRVRFVLRDYGRSCSPENIRSRDLEDIRPGGVGVHIIRKVFDHVDYQPCEQGTKLVLEKLLESAPHDPADANS